MIWGVARSSVNPHIRFLVSSITLLVALTEISNSRSLGVGCSIAVA